MTPTGDILFFVVFLLAVIMTTWSNRELLFAGAAVLLWSWMFFRLFFGDNPIIGREGEFTPFLAFAFISIVLGALLMRMNTAIKHEARGQSWTTWGASPKEGEETSATEAYRTKLRGRLRR